MKLIGACHLAAVVAVHNAEASAHQTHVPRSSPPGPPSILLKVIKHSDSTTQDREPVSDGYTASIIMADNTSSGDVQKS